MANRHKHKIHFDPEKAASELRAIRPLLKEVVQLTASLAAQHYDIYRHRYFGGAGPNGDREYPPQLDRLIEILSGLDQRGILVKSAEAGLVDFPCLRPNGEEVYLCYKLGEETIGYWHRMEEGYAGRRPIAEL